MLSGRESDAISTFAGGYALIKSKGQVLTYLFNQTL